MECWEAVLGVVHAFIFIYVRNASSLLMRKRRQQILLVRGV